MIFSRLTFSENFNRHSVSSSLLEVSSGHWYNPKYLIKIGEDLLLDLVPKSSSSLNLTTLLEKEDLKISLFSWLLEIFKNNKRILDFKFFKKDDQNLILLATSEIQTFVPENFLKREIVFSLHKSSINLHIVDITLEESRLIEKGEKLLPEDWLPLTPLTEELNNYKYLMLD